MTKPTIPEVLPRFIAYYQKPGNGAWGSLHVVIEDSNVDDSSVRFSIDWAERHGDQDGKDLGELLLTMSKTQRLKIFDAVSKAIRLGQQKPGPGNR